MLRRRPLDGGGAVLIGEALAQVDRAVLGGLERREE
jgi:hypothetical protein